MNPQNPITCDWTKSLVLILVIAGLISGATLLLAPRHAQATPQYSAETKLPCGRCHVNPAGGGPNTAFGKAFAANGHKIPPKK